MQYKMEIKVNITKKDLKHLENCDGHYSACGTVIKIINKIKSANSKSNRNKDAN